MPPTTAGPPNDTAYNEEPRGPRPLILPLIASDLILVFRAPTLSLLPAPGAEHSFRYPGLAQTCLHNNLAATAALRGVPPTTLPLWTLFLLDKCRQHRRPPLPFRLQHGLEPMT